MSGRAKPATMRSSVVLPHPEGPSSAKNSFSAKSRSTAFTAVTSPNRLVRPWREITVRLSLIP